MPTTIGGGRAAAPAAQRDTRRVTGVGLTASSAPRSSAGQEFNGPALLLYPCDTRNGRGAAAAPQANDRRPQFSDVKDRRWRSQLLK